VTATSVEGNGPPLVPCAKCGDANPIGSLVVEGSRRRMYITGTQYTCMGEDCDMAAPPCQQGDEGARENWNAAQARYANRHLSDEEQLK
jgi:hypothetical protein